MLVYDVTSQDSLQKVRDWVKELNKMLGVDNIKLAIIGNKMDLLPTNEQKCPQNNPLVREALQLTNELSNAKHYLTSAKLNQGIGEMFISLAKRMIEQTKRQLDNARDNRPTSVTSRILKTLSVTDDRNSDDDEFLDRGSNLQRRVSRININNSSTNKRDQSSCQCWR